MANKYAEQTDALDIQILRKGFYDAVQVLGQKCGDQGNNSQFPMIHEHWSYHAVFKLR